MAGTFDVAGGSVKVAKQSEQHAARIACIEGDRDPETFRPQLLNAEFDTEDNERTKTEHLFFDFSLPRAYRVAGYATHQGRAHPALCGSGRKRWRAGAGVRAGSTPSAGRTDSRVPHFQFWPPDPIDDVDRWSCPCGAPAPSGEAAHWEIVVPVKTPKGRITGPLLNPLTGDSDWEDEGF